MSEQKMVDIFFHNGKRETHDWSVFQHCIQNVPNLMDRIQLIQPVQLSQTSQLLQPPPLQFSQPSQFSLASQLQSCPLQPPPLQFSQSSQFSLASQLEPLRAPQLLKPTPLRSFQSLQPPQQSQLHSQQSQQPHSQQENLDRQLFQLQRERQQLDQLKQQLHLERQQLDQQILNRQLAQNSVITTIHENRCYCELAKTNTIKSPRNQRPIDQDHVDALHNRWKDLSEQEFELSVWTLSLVLDEVERVYWIIDGQHRVEVFKRLCHEGKHRPFFITYARGSEDFAADQYSRFAGQKPQADFRNIDLKDVNAVLMLQNDIFNTYGKDHLKLVTFNDRCNRPHVNAPALAKAIIHAYSDRQMVEYRSILKRLNVFCRETLETKKGNVPYTYATIFDITLKKLPREGNCIYIGMVANKNYYLLLECFKACHPELYPGGSPTQNFL